MSVQKTYIGPELMKYAFLDKSIIKKIYIDTTLVYELGTWYLHINTYYNKAKDFYSGTFAIKHNLNDNWGSFSNQGSVSVYYGDIIYLSAKNAEDTIYEYCQIGSTKFYPDANGITAIKIIGEQEIQVHFKNKPNTARIWNSSFTYPLDLPYPTVQDRFNQRHNSLVKTNNTVTANIDVGITWTSNSGRIISPYELIGIIPSGFTPRNTIQYTFYGFDQTWDYTEGTPTTSPSLKLSSTRDVVGTIKHDGSISNGNLTTNPEDIYIAKSGGIYTGAILRIHTSWTV